MSDGDTYAEKQRLREAARAYLGTEEPITLAVLVGLVGMAKAIRATHMGNASTEGSERSEE